MAKVTTQHALTINKLMIPLINTVAYYDENETDLTMFTMCVSDIAHNVAALDVFNTTLCAGTLHDNIMQQDTLPREHFYTVLKYIEDNKLISAKYYTCS
jgi:hypothetical protein